MTPTAKLEAYAQSIYLILKNRHYDEIEGEDGQAYIDAIIDWTNMFLDEIETTTDPNGGVVDWWFSRSNGYILGTATEGQASISTPSAVDHLITDELRYVQILQDTSVISNWAVVNASNITNKNDRIIEDTCAVVGNNIVFSRAFRDTEDNGTIIGDVSLSLPRLSKTNLRVLDIVKPFLLLKLGVAKNAILPDIVQGQLSPNYSQKFDTLLDAAIAKSMQSSRARMVNRQAFGDVRGLY